MADLELTDDVPPEADDGVWLTCIECGEQFAPFDEIRYTCDDCDGLLEVRYADLPTFENFEQSGAVHGGVWRIGPYLRITGAGRVPPPNSHAS